MYNPDELKALLTLDAFPRSAGYDPDWVGNNLMGPNVLWLTEWLTQKVRLEPGMRVLDMGCGTAISSIFLAKEFGVEVWAADLWIDPSENLKRIEAAGVERRVFPLRAEAHELPFAEGFFDAAVSMDAYQYFGTSDTYLPYYLKFLKAGAELGIVVPGIKEEFERVPEHLKEYWGADTVCFHSPAWWRHHWAKTGLVGDVAADWLEDGWEQWLLWHEVGRDQGYGFYKVEMNALKEDTGRNLGFTRIVATKRQPTGERL